MSTSPAIQHDHQHVFHAWESGIIPFVARLPVGLRQALQPSALATILPDERSVSCRKRTATDGASLPSTSLAEAANSVLSGGDTRCGAILSVALVCTRPKSTPSTTRLGDLRQVFTTRSVQVNPHIRKEKWTPEEDRSLAALVALHGNKWADIAKQYGPLFRAVNRAQCRCQLRPPGSRRHGTVRLPQ